MKLFWGKFGDSNNFLGGVYFGGINIIVYVLWLCRKNTSLNTSHIIADGIREFDKDKEVKNYYTIKLKFNTFKL